MADQFQSISNICVVLVASVLFSPIHCTILREKFHITTIGRVTGPVILTQPAFTKVECAGACVKCPDCRTLTYSKVSGVCQLYAGTSPRGARVDRFVSIYSRSAPESNIPRRNYTKGRLLLTQGRVLKQISLDDHTVESYPPLPWTARDLAFSEKHKLVFASHGSKVDSCVLDTSVCKTLRNSVIVSFIAVDDENDLLFLSINKGPILKMSLNGQTYPEFAITGSQSRRVAPYPEQKALFVVESRSITLYSYSGKGKMVDTVVSGSVSYIAFDPVGALLYYIDYGDRDFRIRRKVFGSRDMFGEILIRFPSEDKLGSLLYHEHNLFTTTRSHMYHIRLGEGAMVPRIIHNYRKHRSWKRAVYCFIP